jgi:outer membrane protein TolC
LQRQDEFENKTVAYNSQPVTIGYQQSLFGYNSLKWDKRIEPLKYQQAKKAYKEEMELIASRASTYFFSLASAQTEQAIAEYNYASADTLSRYAQGRYEIGTITESEMLQLNLNKLTEETNVLNARTELENAMQSVRSYLALENNVVIKVEIDSDVPDFKADLSETLRLARLFSPDPDYYELRKCESRSSLAYAKANSGLKADLYMQFGLSQTADNLKGSYHSPQNQQYASIGLSLPILDWGRGKGRVKVAQSNVDLVDTQVEQAYKDFDINVSKMVQQFNLQAYRVRVAEKTAMLAKQRYDVARRLYILGKSTILDFNSATSEKDSALRSHISSLRTFWSLYYGLRSMTGGAVPM